MKTSTETNVAMKAIDLELKALLEKDLKNFKAMRNRNNQATGKQLLAA